MITRARVSSFGWLVARTSLTLSLIALASCRNDVGDQGWAMGAGNVGPTLELAMENRCAAGTTVKGIDVSYYQGTIDWAQVADDGVKYAFIRVSDGLGFHDSKFERNWQKAKRAGVTRGAYQFFRSDEDAVAQADLLIAAVGGKLSPGDLPPVIDVESTDGKSATTIKNKVRQWSNRIQDKLKVKPIIYTGPYFWRDQVNGADMNDHKLWVAHYGTSCPLVPPTWTKWTFHQHTSSGRVDGIAGDVDMNKFNGTLTQLRDLTVKDDRPRACVTGNFDGAFCDDDSHGSEPAHNRLKQEFGVNFHCGDIAGEPAYCPTRTATRAQAAFVLGKAADVPLSGHDDAFSDDDGHGYEPYLDAAQDYGVLLGSNGKVRPNDPATRSQLAVILKRMYLLPPADRDYFDDDDDLNNEDAHNRAAAAGLILGFNDANGGRRDFRPGVNATRSMLAVVAGRAATRALVPVWLQ